MVVNFWAIIICTIASIVVGSIWYGPLFGKTWMRIRGVNPADVEARRALQKSAMLFYVSQFLLTLFQVYILALYIYGWADATGLENAFWIWAAFVMPTVAGASMWSNEPRKTKWTQFFIQAGYQLVMFVIYGLALGNWR